MALASHYTQGTQGRIAKIARSGIRNSQLGHFFMLSPHDHLTPSLVMASVIVNSLRQSGDAIYSVDRGS